MRAKPVKPGQEPKQPSPAMVEQISAQAYRFWIQEGKPDGRDLEHWLMSEKLLAAAHERLIGSAPATRNKSAKPNGSARTGGRSKRQAMQAT